MSRNGVKHNVLNAKQHEREAEIVAQAGRKGAVTIATNMAGRGTDILLGGNADFMFKQILYREENLPDERKLPSMKRSGPTAKRTSRRCIALGGLHILGTERHESRRIDNQLRGRAGRQGDPGSSRFYLSLEDDLMRIFASERVSQLMLKLGMEEGVPIEHGMVTRAIANAQKKVEAHNFEIRKQLLEYDDVMNKQREVIYQHRRAVLSGENLTDDLRDMMDGAGGVRAQCLLPRGTVPGRMGHERARRNDAGPVRPRHHPRQAATAATHSGTSGATRCSKI